jgi:hypothetical protein
MAVTLPSNIAKSVAPRTTIRDAKIFSSTVSGPTHGVFMSVVSDQYNEDMYCCEKGVTVRLVSSLVDPSGTRSSHDLPWYDVSPVEAS